MLRTLEQVQNRDGTDLLQTRVVGGALPYGGLLHQFGGGLLLLVQHLQLHRLLQVGLRWCLGLWRLALVHGSSTRALAQPWGRTGTRGSLLTVGNVGLLGGLRASLRVEARLEERSRGEGEAWVHLEAWKSNWGRDDVSWGGEPCRGATQETWLEPGGHRVCVCVLVRTKIHTPLLTHNILFGPKLEKVHLRVQTWF